MKSVFFQRFVSRWPLAIAAVFCVYSLVLLTNAFQSQAQLRSEAEARVIAESTRRAATVGDVIDELRSGAVELAQTHEIANYLINRSLGMSPHYGLNVNLYAIEERFKRQVERVSHRGAPIYERIVFYDESAQPLVDLKPEGRTLSPSANASGGSKVLIDAASREIVVSMPVMFKGRYSGMVATVSGIERLAHDLISSDAGSAYMEVLISADGRILPATGIPKHMNDDLVKALSELPENKLSPIANLPDGKSARTGGLVLRSRVPGSDLSLVTLRAEDTVFGQITSRFFLYSASVVPLIILIAAFMFERVRRIETALAQSEQRFRTIFDNIRDAIFIIDMDTGAIIEANPRMLDLYGYNREEALGLTQADIGESLEPHRPGEWADRMAAAQADQPQFFAWHTRRKGGELFWAEISMLRATIDGRDRLLVVARDISQRRAQEQELLESLESQRQLIKKLEDTQNQLLQSEKMASIGQLAAGVAHEINNPVGYVHSNMNTLHGYVDKFLELLEIYEEVDATIGEPNAALARARAARAEMDIAFLKDDVRSLFAESNQGVERVIKIIKDLKDFSHVDREEKWMQEDLHRGLESTLNVIWNELKYKCEVKKVYGNLPLVECLIFQLDQVFMNLLVNAAQAIEKRGTITIRTGVDGDHVRIEISDDGKGIPQSNLKRIFDPFFTTKPVGKGTGLGLSVSYSIIEKHHGSIEVESREGEGTTFCIRLPVRQPVAAEVGDAAA